ncbi:hypothetical protein Tco_1032460 [Tanacetum coccineum]|uniref:Uncharacterized protein n=1 Tax=Tanacetum coccineum TaxID=301880 RepID=A0ABQ4ZYZ7_9ASTR
MEEDYDSGSNIRDGLSKILMSLKKRLEKLLEWIDLSTQLVLGLAQFIVFRKKGLLERLDRKMSTIVPRRFLRFFPNSNLFQMTKDKDHNSPAHTNVLIIAACLFGLCNAPGSFRRCYDGIFPDMMKRQWKVFMDEFSVLEIDLFLRASPI